MKRDLDLAAPKWCLQCGEPNSLNNFARANLPPEGQIPMGGYMKAMNTAAHPDAPLKTRTACDMCSPMSDYYGYLQPKGSSGNW